MSERKVGSDLFHAVFQMVEKSNLEDYLISRLRKVSTVSILSPDSVEITFANGWKATLINDLEVYYLDINHEYVYCNGESASSKLSDDRVSFYLNRVLDIVMYGR
jgi:hypothetical protein